MGRSKYPESGLSAVLDLENWSGNVRLYLRNVEQLNRADKSTEQASKRSERALRQQERALRDTGRSAGQAGRGISRFTERLLQLDAGIRVLNTAWQAVGRLTDATTDLSGRAYRVQGVSRAFANITARIGDSAELLAQWRRQAQGAVSDLELMRLGNIALINTSRESAEVIGRGYGTVIRAAFAGAQATGQDLSFILDKINRSLRRQSNALLDDIGVWVDAETANRNYAEQLGITVAQMTDAQRAAAFQAEAIRQMDDILAQTGDITIPRAVQAAARWENALNNVSIAMQGGSRETENALAGISMGIATFVDRSAPYLGAFADSVGEAFGAVGDQADSLLGQLDPEAFFTGGANIIAALANGMLRGLTYVVQVVNLIASTIADFLMGFSPPKKGPLSQIDLGGRKVVEAWIKAFDKVSLEPVEDLAGQVRDLMLGITDLPAADQVTVLEQLQNRLQKRLEKAVAALSRGQGNAAEVRLLDAQRVALSEQLDLLREKAALERVGLKFQEKGVQVEKKRTAAVKATKIKAPKGLKRGDAALPAVEDVMAGIGVTAEGAPTLDEMISGQLGIEDSGPAGTQSRFRRTLDGIFGGIEESYQGFIDEVGRLKDTLDTLDPFGAVTRFLDSFNLDDINSISDLATAIGGLGMKIVSLPADLFESFVNSFIDITGIEINPEVSQTLTDIARFLGFVLSAKIGITAILGLAGGISQLATSIGLLTAAAVANPIFLLAIAIGGLLFVIDRFGPDALDTLNTLAGLIRIAFDEVKTSVERAVLDLQIWVLEQVQKLDEALESAGIDIIPDVDVQLDQLNARREAYELRDDLEQEIANVIGGEENALSAEAWTMIGVQGVQVSERARAAVEAALQEAISSGDDDRIRVLARLAADLNIGFRDENIAHTVGVLLESGALADPIPVDATVEVRPSFVWTDPETGQQFEVGGVNAPDAAFMSDPDSIYDAWFGGGQSAGEAWASGVENSAARAGEAAETVSRAAANYIVGQSPPPLGPLSTVDLGGQKVVEAWLAAFTNADLTVVYSFAETVEAVISKAAAALEGELSKLRLTTEAWFKATMQADAGLLKLHAELQQYVKDTQRAIKETLRFSQTLWRIPEGLARLDVHFDFTIPFGGARAGGGPVSAGRAYMVGEEGPEWFVPNLAGQILPQATLTPTVIVPPPQVVVVDGSGGAGNVTVNQTFNGRADPGSVRRAMYELQAAGVL